MSTGSSSIIVAVTDTGVDYTHPDLTANMWSDANGSHGYDFVNNDSDPMDDEGHGTHVSGTIGAVGNNGIGVAGVNWHTRIMAVKFLDATGSGSTSNAVATIQYAIANGAKVINASWGGYGFSQTLYDTIAAARDAGIIFVAAAGNESNNNDSTPAYPASFNLANIISVMATTNTDASASYSNYGLTTVDLGAPGGSGFGDSTDILSTLLGGGYGYKAGTSMASPHVAGACALLLSIDPTLTYSQVKQILMDTVNNTLPGLCASGGRLNLAAAVQEAAVDSTPPTPNPPQWAAGAAPKATGRHTAIMQAAAVTDRSGVEYYFECVSDVNKNSGWTANTLYTITTLSPATTYGFHFKARDKSSNHNQTGWSITGFVTTSVADDNLSPFPDPPQWLKPPVAYPQFNQIRMIAGIGYDESTPVQYQFSYQYKANPEVILPWQPSNLYYFTPPTSEPNTTVYNFRFHVRDANGNETVEWSMFASARMFTGSRVISVPAQYGTIQPALDAAVNGDIVEISPYPYFPYTYNGNGNYNLTFGNSIKAITVRSTEPTNPDVVAATVIDCQGTNNPNDQRRGFIFNNGQGPGCVLAGLTIRNGYAKGAPGLSPPANPLVSGGNAYGGGICCGGPTGISGSGGSPTISNCIIENCTVEGGNGANGSQGDPCMPGGKGGNSGFAGGGGIYCSANSNPIIQNCTIRNCNALAGVPGNGGNGGNGNPGGKGGAGGWNYALAGGGIYVGGSNPTIVGCTITNCNAFNLTNVGTPGQGGTGTPPGNPGAPGLFLETDGYGGGIYYSAGSNNANISATTISQNQIYGPTLIDVTTNELIYPKGGGIFLTGGSVRMTDCNINENDGTNGGCDGAGIANINTLTLRNCTLNNNAASHSGGGLFAANTATIYDSSFTGNDAIYGGGIYLDSASLTFWDSRLVNNTAAEGGGINGYNTAVNIYGSDITGNAANMPGGMGGGVAFWNTAGDINNCLLKDNVALDVGGAAFMDGWTTSPLQFTNCLITDNNAFYEGGALSCNLSGWAKLLNCTLIGNSATSTTYGTGGAISSAEYFALVQLENCILWDNSALNGPQIAVGTIFGSLQDGGAGPYANVDVEYSDVEGGEDAFFLEDPPEYTWVWWLAGNLTDDPMFVDIDVNAPSYYLSQVKAGQLTNSPCVDAGDIDMPAHQLELMVGEDLTTRTDQVRDACVVDIGYHYTVTTAPQYSLTIEVVNDTGGTLTAQGGGDSAFTITAPVTVTRMVNAGMEVSLHATAQPGFALLGWTGTNDDTSTSTDNTVTMNANKVVKVTFHQYQLTIQVLKPGGFDPNGFIAATGDGIDPFTITSRNEPNSRGVAPGTVVQLTAFPDVNYNVLSWSGTDNDGSTALTNTVTMNSDVNVIVSFQPDGFYYLIVSVAGGQGTVEPVGRTLQPKGVTVQLKATPANPLDKVAWTGTDDDNSPAQINKVTMDTHKNVTVEFYTPRILYVGGDSNYPNIQMAIDAANNRDIVMITPGTYNIVESSQDHSYLLINGKDITLTSTSPENPEATVITGKFMIYNVSRKCVIQGLTISGNVYWDDDIFDPVGIWFEGTSTEAGRDGQYPGDTPGAGMTLNNNASPTIRNVGFVNCRAMGIHGADGAGGEDPYIPGTTGNGGPGGRAMGGGAYIGPDNSPTFENCSFTGCQAVGGDGGNGAAAAAPGEYPGHGGAWGDKNGFWWDYRYHNYSLLDYWEYSGFGGAIYCGEGSTAEFVNCNFINNTTIGGSCGISGAPIEFGWPYSHYKIQSFGGAVFAAAGSAPSFTDCNFTDNMADPNCALTSFRGGATVAAYPTTSYGGAIAFENGASPLFTKCTFTDNLAAVGGAVYCDEAYPEFDASAFIGNSALHGGGVMFSQGFAVVNRCFFTGNQGTYPAAQGGAIAALGANAEITDCNILRNRSAGDGGGIYVSSRNIGGTEAPGGNSVLIKNCLITNNSADANGGGIAAVWFSDPNIVNCTIVNNTAGGAGAGVSSSYGSFVNIVNNIIWGNVTGIGANGSQLAVSVAPSAMLVHYSDVQGATDPNQFGRNIQSLDLVFCIDTTGSMADDIDAVKAAARQIINAIGAQFPDYRVAEVNYRDFYDDMNTAATYGSPGDRPYRDAVDFTSDASQLIAGLQPMVAGGGADGPEAVYAALMHCIDANALEARLIANGNARFIDFNSPGVGAWRQGRDVLRVVMLMGDAPPHDPEPYTDYTLNDIATAATGPNPVHVMPILIGNATDATAAFTSIATATGGTVVQAADANAVVGAVLQAVGLMKQIPTPIFVDVNCVINWDPCTMQWEPGSGNINADPCFVAGYFLSQIPAGQPVTSPCVDTGSADANSPGIDLANYTTRTDYVGDQGVVDMGYHYPYHYPLFTPPQYRLDFNAVVANGLEANDIEPNSGLFNWFTTVQLRVKRQPGNFQVLWTGTDNDDSSALTNTVLMDGPRAVTVAFVSNACILTTEVIGGHGTVMPTGGTYSRNTVVALTAVPDTGYRVKRWTGTDNDGLFAPANTVKMAGDKNVTVEFEVPLIRTVPGDFTTIQGAVNAARPGDIVSVASGVYNTPGLEINKEITITSTNPDDPCVVAMTVIDGNGIAGTGIVFYAGATGRTVLNGITIANCGYGFVPALAATVVGAPGPDGGSGSGAGIVVDSGASPTIKNCIIRNCNITGGNAGAGGNADATTPAGHGGWGGWARGAGIYVAQYANPTFINCTVRNCTVTGGNGGNGGNFAQNGGDAGPGGNWSDGVLWQTWGYIGDYRFYSGYGAGVFCDANSSASFVACNIINNTASGGLSGIGGNRAAGVQIPMPDTAYRLPGYGGGVYCGNNANITFIDCNIKGNLAPKPDATYHTDPYLGHGGGIAFEETAFVTLTGCNISDNISAVGGGMFWLNSAPAIRDCNISANIAYIGGGIYGQYGAGGGYRACLIEDCNIYRNFAGISTGDVDVIAGQGGGIFCESIDASIIDSRFVDNTTDASGAGIYFHGPVSSSVNAANVTNCLMIGNTAGRDGGGISANWNVSVKIANCTLHSNNATGSFGDPNGHTGLGGGLYCAYGASTSVIDSILWRNDASFGPEIAVDTGFELDQHCGSVNVSYSDVRGGSAGTYVGESGNCSAYLTWAGGNIGVDPKFVSEIISDYRLQQVAAGQLPANQSPCVDVGSSSAINAGLGLYTTRTDEVPDRGRVDMGYHYMVEQPCRFVDIGSKILGTGRTKWMKDGIIDWTDFAVLADSWLSGSCSPANAWCKGADLTFDSSVNWEDLSLISQCWLAADTTPPSPNPSQWRIVPTGTWPNKVKMAAVDTVDNLWGLQFDTTHPVQYYFQCTSGNGHDSNGWQYDANYTDTGLQSYVEYAYRVRARDLVGNMTEWSSVQWTVISPDSIPPAPNPMTWNVEPYAASGSSIAMTATTASDDSGGIQYEFEINEPNAPDHTSGWRDDPNYTITGLNPVGPYCFRVRARDVFDNETGWSDQICVSNLGDVTPPSPDPNILWVSGNWDVLETDYTYSGEFRTSDARWWHRVVADVTGITDDSGGPLELRFICSNNGFSSETKVAVPIILGQPPVGGTLGGHSATDTYQVYWNGSTIVYDVYINTSSGLGGDYTWRVCVYDPTLNSACSNQVKIAPLYIGPP
ncbi:MAG: S8 family serine peptidase [Sedimentisphaerales bacterium]